jgi:hypothetical protein
LLPRRFGGTPRLREAQTLVQTHRGCHGSQGKRGRLLEGRPAGQVERGVLPRNGVLCVAAAGSAHLVESRDAISGLEFVHVLADRMHHAGNVVSRVGGFGLRVISFLGIFSAWRCCVLRLHPPILWVGAAHGNFDQNLIGIWSLNRRVHDLDREVDLDDCFFHGGDEMGD